MLRLRVSTTHREVREAAPAGMRAATHRCTYYTGLRMNLPHCSHVSLATVFPHQLKDNCNNHHKGALKVNTLKALSTLADTE